jgi:hypothetical protein
MYVHTICMCTATPAPICTLVVVVHSGIRGAQRTGARADDSSAQRKPRPIEYRFTRALWLAAPFSRPSKI